MEIALVTGGAKGIGQEISKKLAKLGYFVIINYYHSEEDAEKLVSYGVDFITSNILE